MLEIKRFLDFSEFYNYNFDFIESNRMLYVFLRRTMDEVFQENIQPIRFFNIENDNRTQIVVLVIPDICLIYSNHYNSKFIPLLSEELEFHEFLRYNFAGSKQTIESLLKYNNAEYSIQKHLIIYKCENVSLDFNYSHGEMQLASINDLDTLTVYNISFNKEYNGTIINYEEASDFLKSGIKDNKFYIWRKQDEICSIATVILRDENDYPEIGHVYTDPKFRNMGFAPSLVHSLTNLLLSKSYQKCMLYTKGTNPASNRAFTKIGYTITGEYIMCYKEI